MLSTYLNLSYHLWVLALTSASIAGIVLLVMVILNIYHQCATHAKAHRDYSNFQKFWYARNEMLKPVVVSFFLIAIGAVGLSFGSAILAVVIGGDTNAL